MEPWRRGQERGSVGILVCDLNRLGVRRWGRRWCTYEGDQGENLGIERREMGAGTWD